MKLNISRNFLNTTYLPTQSVVDYIEDYDFESEDGSDLQKTYNKTK